MLARRPGLRLRGHATFFVAPSARKTYRTPHRGAKEVASASSDLEFANQYPRYLLPGKHEIHAALAIQLERDGAIDGIDWRLLELALRRN